MSHFTVAYNSHNIYLYIFISFNITNFFNVAIIFHWRSIKMICPNQNGDQFSCTVPRKYKFRWLFPNFVQHKNFILGGMPLLYLNLPCYILDNPTGTENRGSEYIIYLESFWNASILDYVS